MVKLVIFDFDGTLANSKEVSIRIYNELSEKYKLSKIDNVHNIWTIPLFKRFKALNLSIEKLPFFAVDFTKQYKDSLESITLVNGTKELLTDLKELGYKLAIVSANSQSNIRDFLRKNQIDIFDNIISSRNLLGKEKVVKSLLNTHQCTSSEAIYVGDEITDIVACNKLGVKIIWVDWGYDSIEMLNNYRPDYIVSSPKDILSILPKH
jgi:phosphoglycolate phosphatase